MKSLKQEILNENTRDHQYIHDELLESLTSMQVWRSDDENPMLDKDAQLI